MVKVEKVIIIMFGLPYVSVSAFLAVAVALFLIFNIAVFLWFRFIHSDKDGSCEMDRLEEKYDDENDLPF